MLSRALCSNEIIDGLLRTPQHRGMSLAQIETEVQRQFPGRVDVVIYGKSFTPGWSQIPNSKGIIAILIGIQSPRDAASGLPTGFSAREAGSGMATGIVSPRDSASGLPTGKRQHKPFMKLGGAVGWCDDWFAPVGFTYEKITWI